MSVKVLNYLYFKVSYFPCNAPLYTFPYTKHMFLNRVWEFALVFAVAFSMWHESS